MHQAYFRDTCEALRADADIGLLSEHLAQLYLDGGAWSATLVSDYKKVRIYLAPATILIITTSRDLKSYGRCCRRNLVCDVMMPDFRYETSQGHRSACGSTPRRTECFCCGESERSR